MMLQTVQSTRSQKKYSFKLNTDQDIPLNFVIDYELPLNYNANFKYNVLLQLVKNWNENSQNEQDNKMKHQTVYYLHSCLKDLSQIKDINAFEQQLDRIYEWYQNYQLSAEDLSTIDTSEKIDLTTKISLRSQFQNFNQQSKKEFKYTTKQQKFLKNQEIPEKINEKDLIFYEKFMENIWFKNRQKELFENREQKDLLTLMRLRCNSLSKLQADQTVKRETNNNNFIKVVSNSNKNYYQQQKNELLKDSFYDNLLNDFQYKRRNSEAILQPQVILKDINIVKNQLQLSDRKTPLKNHQLKLLRQQYKNKTDFKNVDIYQEVLGNFEYNQNWHKICPLKNNKQSPDNSQIQNLNLSKKLKNRLIELNQKIPIKNVINGQINHIEKPEPNQILKKDYKLIENPFVIEAVKKKRKRK